MEWAFVIRPRRSEPHSGRVDAYLLDVKLPDGNGIDLLREIRGRGIPAPVIMISGHGTIRDAVEATRAGAYDFLEKPLARDKVLLALKNALEQSSLREENERLREMVGSGPRMIGASPAWQRAVEQAGMAAQVGCPGAADRGVGYWEGVARSARARRESVSFGPIREGQLRGDSDGAD